MTEADVIIEMSMPPGVNKAYDPARSVDKKTGKVSAKIIKNNIARQWADYARNQIVLQAPGLKIPNRYKMLIQIPEGDYDTDHFEKEIIDSFVNAEVIKSDKSRYNMGFAVEVVDGLRARRCRISIWSLPADFTKPCIEEISTDSLV